jgi:hypothetical protein
LADYDPAAVAAWLSRGSPMNVYREAKQRQLVREAVADISRIGHRPEHYATIATIANVAHHLAFPVSERVAHAL